MENTKKMTLTVAFARCSDCGFERKLYFLPDFLYGERILTTKNGGVCAYANLLNETVTEELKEICSRILEEKGIDASKHKIGRMVAAIYPLTCDAIDGIDVNCTPNWKCPNCGGGKMQEDKDRGEKPQEVDAYIVRHDVWNSMDDQQKAAAVEREMASLGYIDR